MSTTDGTERLMRWQMRFSEYEFDFHYSKGIHNSVTDCMSRISIICEKTESIAKEIPCFTLSEEDEEDSAESRD